MKKMFTKIKIILRKVNFLYGTLKLAPVFSGPKEIEKSLQDEGQIVGKFPKNDCRAFDFDICILLKVLYSELKRAFESR